MNLLICLTLIGVLYSLVEMLYNCINNITIP